MASNQLHNAAWIHLFDICRQRSLPVGPVIHWKKCYGLSERLPSETRQQIMQEMASRGVSAQEIAAVFGMGREVVRRALLSAKKIIASVATEPATNGSHATQTSPTSRESESQSLLN